MREELRSEGNWTPASLILNLRTRRGLSLTKTESVYLIIKDSFCTFGGLGHLSCHLDIKFFNVNLLLSLALLLSY